MSSEPGRYRRAALPLLFLALFALAVGAFSGLSHDDAYIAYRYGENLASGRGLVFNPGERVLGFTSPLHVLVAAAAHAVVGHAALPRVMAALGCAAWMAQALVVWRLLGGPYGGSTATNGEPRAPLGRVAATLVAVLVAVGGAGSARWVALETNLAVALSLGALMLALDERWRSAAAVCGFACLARPDAGLMAALLAGYGAFRLRSRVLVPASLFLAVVLPWLVVATGYFGSPVPEPLRVKFQRTGFSPYLEHLLREGTTTLLRVDEPGGWLAALAWLLAVRGAIFLVARSPRLGLFVAYGALHIASYLYLRPFRAHAWHLYPGLFVLAVCAWSLVVGGLAARPAPRARVLACIAGGALIFVYTWGTVGLARTYPTAEWFGARDRTYRAAAAYLRENLRANEQVAAVEVGTLGYFSNVRMYDLGGLVTKRPVIASQFPGLSWPYACIAVDDHYPSLVPAGQAPVREWAGGFPLRLFCRR